MVYISKLFSVNIYFISNIKRCDFCHGDNKVTFRSVDNNTYWMR